MTSDTIHQVMEQYIANGEMAGGALIVRKNDEIVFDGKWGWADMPDWRSHAGMKLTATMPCGHLQPNIPTHPGENKSSCKTIRL